MGHPQRNISAKFSTIRWQAMNDGAQDSKKIISQPPATDSHARSLGPLIKFLGENLKPIIASLAIGVASTIGVLLSPVRDVIQHHLWREKASILLSTSVDRVQEGSSVALRFIVTPLSPRPLDPGVITITFDHSFWTLNSGDILFDSPAISSPVILPDKVSLDLLAIKPGTTVGSVDLQTRYGTYRDEKRLYIDPVQIGEDATRSNFTGMWTLQIGNSHGKMEIRQSGHTDIAGSYYLDDGDKGVIDGWRDGVSFYATIKEQP